jgi:hypothetical protein
MRRGTDPVSKRGGKTHSLGRLGTAAVASFPELAELVVAIDDWSAWAAAFRYPDEDAPPEPDEATIRAALGIIELLAARLRAANPEPSAK